MMTTNATMPTRIYSMIELPIFYSYRRSQARAKPTSNAKNTIVTMTTTRSSMDASFDAIPGADKPRLYGLGADKPPSYRFSGHR
jgi:hypothetical protein